MQFRHLISFGFLIGIDSEWSLFGSGTTGNSGIATSVVGELKKGKNITKFLPILKNVVVEVFYLVSFISSMA